MIKDIEQIKEEFKEFATKHKQLNDFYFGSFIDAYESKKLKYACLIVDCVSAVPGGSADKLYVDLDFLVTVCDKVYDDKANEINVKSDCLLYLEDVRTIMQSERWKSFGRVINEPAATYFKERGGDAVDGWVTTIRFRVYSFRDICAIPLEGYSTGAVYQSNCPKVAIIKDGEFLEWVDAGGQYSYSSTDGGDVVIYYSDGITIVSTVAAPGAYTIQKHSISNSVGQLYLDEFDNDRILPDINVTVVNSDLDIVNTAIEPSVQNVTISAPDGHVHIKKMNDGSIANVATPSGVTTEYSIADSTAVIKNSAGTTLFSESIMATESENITIPDDTVRNSDSSYIASDVVQGVVKVLPDITFTDTDGSTSSKPSVKNFSATLIPALSGAQLNHPDNGLTLAQRQLINRVHETRTGQTTSYRTGDDGDFEYGRNTAFTTLASANPFGNTNRFTDRNGGQTYASNIVVDWLTGLMWLRTPTSGADWNAAIDGALAATDGGYTDWFLPNFQQLFSIGSFGNTQLLNYAPFSLTITTTGSTLWTSTTRAASTTEAYILSLNGAISNVAKTGTNRSYIYCRQFTYTNGVFS